MTAPIEYWHVKMPDGSVSTMTLDEPDEAFQADRIGEHSLTARIDIHDGRSTRES